MLRDVRTMPDTSGSCSRLTACTSTGRYVPSAARNEELAGDDRAWLGDDFLAERHHPNSIVGVQQVEDRPVGPELRRITEDRPVTPRRLDQRTVLVDQRDRVVDVLDQLLDATRHRSERHR